ncbi:MAG: hypothetical protein KF778_03625 [Rhodocyclaceae bacterium]|nr:hypothetical protein [Rhodocyclaceae bacterium]MBX3667468.1 hypothetical protein [Rhodocyclaceae bacterium]
MPAKILLGVIIEVPQQGGLDVLAAFSDGSVRYLNQSGKASIFEGGDHPAAALAHELIGVARAVVDQIGPWDKLRLPAPQGELVRLSFVVSDGLYFGQGAWEVLQRDAKGGPLLAKATQLLQQVIAVARQPRKCRRPLAATESEVRFRWWPAGCCRSAVNNDNGGRACTADWVQNESNRLAKNLSGAVVTG